MARERLGRLVVEGAAARLLVESASGVEGMGQPFGIEVTARAIDGSGEPVAMDLDALVGQRATCAVALGDGGERTMHGVVEGAEQRYGELRLTIASRVAPLADTIDHQVFLQQDAAEIARVVLAEHGLDVDARVSRRLPKRAQCVQAFESGLAFVSRILAEEGIAWFVEHNSGSDVVVFADSPAAHAPIPGDSQLPFVAEAGLVEEDCVIDVRLRRAVVRDALRLCDYDFEHPRADLRAEARAGAGALTRYEVPGGYRDGATGEVVAGLRLEEARAERLVLTGRTNCRRFAPGRTFELTRAARRDLNTRWLLLEVRWELRSDASSGSEDRRFEAAFVAIPAGTPYRPLRARPPTLAGVQTATVTGPAGAEIHTNAHGQVTALLRWDRRRKKDETSSTWIRPLQPQTSGSMFLPRVGWEALLGFSGASADKPYVLGRLDNGASLPAEALPTQKVRSAFGSCTTPGGGGANTLRMDDAAGYEDMLLNASSDYNERTESDKTVDVKGTDVHEIGANRTQIVGAVCAMKVDGAQSTSVGASRTVNVGGAMAFGLGSESVTVGGARLFEVGGDYATEVSGALTRAVGAAKIETAIAGHSRHVSGGAAVVVGGCWHEIGTVASVVGVAGAHIRVIGGPINVRAPKYGLKATALDESFGSYTVSGAGFIQEGFKGAASLSIDGSVSLRGSKVIVKAKSSLTIEAAGMTIKMTPTSIDVQGPFESGVKTKVTGTDKSDG